MKKAYLILGSILLIIIIAGGFYYFNKEKVSWENASNLDLNYNIEYLEECYENLDLSSEEAYDLRDSGDIGDALLFCVTDGKENIPVKEDIEKFKLLNNIKVIEICEKGNWNCDLSKDVKDPCEEIWKISYESLGVKPHDILWSVNKCGREYYLYYSFSKNGPTQNSIRRIQLSEEIFQKLRI